MAVKKGLGRGLNTLLPSDTEVEKIMDSKAVFELKITEVEPDSSQPRMNFDEEKLSELAQSIQQYGVVQPIIVKKTENGFYKIIAGERRWRASKIAGLKKIPAILREYDEKNSKEIALIENLQRENLNPIEEALGYKKLIDEYNMTQEELADKMGKKRPSITNSLRLLSLPEEIRDMVSQNLISQGHAKAVLSAENPEIQKAAAEKIIRDNLNVRQTEVLIKFLTAQPKKKIKKKEDKETVRYYKSLEEKLSQKIGTRVKIVRNKNKGKIEIPYSGIDDFERIMRIFG